MQTPWTSVACFLLASLLGAVGQYRYKAGAERATGTWTSYAFNPHLLGGVICYTAVMVLFVAAFKHGGALSVLYPLYATTFIWAALIGLAAYGEPVRPLNIVGMGLLIGGMYLMGR